jgi:hypothetical protein
MKKLFILPVLFSFLLGACKKNDDEPTAPPSNLPAVDTKPVSTAFSTANGYVSNATGSNADKVVGMRFKVARNGRITRLGFSFPAAGSYSIKLWEVSGSNPVSSLSSLTLNQATNGTYVDGGISPVQLVPNKEYLVYVFAGGNQIFLATKAGVSNPFPVVSGNITFLSNQSKIAGPGINVTDATLPTDAGNNGALGIVDFVFVAD